MKFATKLYDIAHLTLSMLLNYLGKLKKSNFLQNCLQNYLVIPHWLGSVIVHCLPLCDVLYFYPVLLLVPLFHLSI